MVKLQKKWKSPQRANCTWLVRVLVKLAENLVPPPQEVKSPQQEGRHLKIYELCRTHRKTLIPPITFFAFTKEDQNFHRPVLESKSYVSKVSSNSQSLSDLFLWSEFSVPFKTFQKGISLIKKFPRSYNSTKKILNKRWKFIRPI